MVLAGDAFFDVRAFLPVQPIQLPPNTCVQVAVTADKLTMASFPDVAEASAREGPPDWSTQLYEYLRENKQSNS